MNTLLLVAMIGLMLATVVVLLTGLAFMAKGGEANAKYSNKLMVARVALQGAAILLLGIFFLVGK